MVSSYVGENAEFERQYLGGELEVELTPQVCCPFSNINTIGKLYPFTIPKPKSLTGSIPNNREL